MSELSRVSLDKLKLAIEALRRANDTTPVKVFIPEPVQRLLTLQLYASDHITESKPEKWHKWTDKKFFDVMQKEFPSDKHRGDTAYCTVMSQLNELRLEIDFTINHSELSYAAKIQSIFEVAGGEDMFSEKERLEFVKTLI